jgi:outer membrane protein OmpA-like peptidoglycan-associated protein
MLDGNLPEWEEYGGWLLDDGPTMQGRQATQPSGTSLESLGVLESPFLLGNAYEIASETEAMTFAPEAPISAPTSPEFLTQKQVAPPREGKNQDRLVDRVERNSWRADSQELDPYAAIRSAMAPEHVDLPANEVTKILGRTPATLVLHQLLNSPVTQQVILASLLGKHGRRSVRVDGSDLSIPAYLRLVSHLCTEVAEQSEQELGGHSTPPTLGSVQEDQSEVAYPHVDEPRPPASWLEITPGRVQGWPPSTGHPLLRRGSRGESVREAQIKLNSVHQSNLAKSAAGLEGAPLVLDGIFGPLTYKVVVSFQRQAFPADPGQWDGVIGPKTWAQLDARILLGAAVPSPLPKTPPEGSAVTIPGCTSIGQPCEVLNKFGHDQAQVTPVHLRQIAKIADCVVASQSTSQPIVSMLVVGHTSTEGLEDYNLRLGFQRADAVIAKLKEAISDRTRGTDRADLIDRITFVRDSGGEKQPIIVDERSEQDRALNRRVEVCLPPLPKVVPPQPPIKLEDAVERCWSVIETQTFPSEQKKRLRCVLRKVLDREVDDHFIIDDDLTRFQVGGIFPRLSPGDFAVRVLRDRVRRQLTQPFFSGPKIRDNEVRDNLDSLDISILAGINRIDRQTAKNSELNVNNPLLRQMQEFVSIQQRSPKSIYFCYGPMPQ